jgi:hypothetical protein
LPAYAMDCKHTPFLQSYAPQHTDPHPTSPTPTIHPGLAAQLLHTSHAFLQNRPSSSEPQPPSDLLQGGPLSTLPPYTGRKPLHDLRPRPQPSFRSVLLPHQLLALQQPQAQQQARQQALAAGNPPGTLPHVAAAAQERVIEGSHTPSSPVQSQPHPPQHSTSPALPFTAHLRPGFISRSVKFSPLQPWHAKGSRRGEKLLKQLLARGISQVGTFTLLVSRCCVLLGINCLCSSAECTAFYLMIIKSRKLCSLP